MSVQKHERESANDVAQWIEQNDFGTVLQSYAHKEVGKVVVDPPAYSGIDFDHFSDELNERGWKIDVLWGDGKLELVTRE